MMYTIIRLLGGWRASAFALALVLALGATGVQTYRVHAAQQDLVALETKLEQQKLASWQELMKAREMYSAALNTKRGEYAALLEDANAKLAVASARIAAGELRPRFRCPSVAAQPGSATGSDGGEGRGLLDTDAEFLVRLAAEADRNTHQLKLAQDTITQMKQACSAGATDG